MVDLADEADLVIEDAIIEIESSPGYDRDIARQIERRRLSEQERDRRLPFLRGVGASLEATLAGDERGWRLAAELLAPVASRLDGVLRLDASLYAAEALVRLGRYDEAGGLLRAVREDPVVDAPALFEAELIEIAMTRARLGPQAALAAIEAAFDAREGDDELLGRLVLTDAKARVHLALAAAASGSDRQHAQRQAYDVYIDMVQLERSLPPRVLRPLVLEKMAALDAGDAPLDELPAIATVARAAGLAGDEATRVEARRLFERALARFDLQELDRATAVLGLAELDLAEDRLDDAATGFARVARDHSATPGAGRAMALAASIATQRWQEAPDDPGVRARLDEILDLAITRYAGERSIDRWRFDAGRLAASVMDFEAAYERFAAVRFDSPLRPSARYRMVAARRDRAQAAAETPQERARWQAVVDVIETVRPELERAVADGRAVASSLTRLAIDEAEARTAMGEPGAALAALERIERMPEDPRIAASALRARIAALQVAGRAAEAHEAVDDFAKLAPDQAVRVLITMLVEARARVEALLDDAREGEATALAEVEMTPLADRLDVLVEDDHEHAAVRDRLVADAYRLAGRFADALPRYEALLRARPDVLETSMGRAECLFGLGGEPRLAEAMRLYRRVAATRSERDRYFWMAELRALQVLDRTGRNTQKIAPRIERLRDEDPDLGGQRTRRGLEALQNKHAG
jgi:tetratricopeptide (TPR) repeat protein